jgi:hypothetical protein
MYNLVQTISGGNNSKFGENISISNYGNILAIYSYIDPPPSLPPPNFPNTRISLYSKNLGDYYFVQNLSGITSNFESSFIYINQNGSIIVFPSDTLTPNNKGVNIYRYTGLSGWDLTKRLETPISVSNICGNISGNILVLGAPFDSNLGGFPNSGAVYIFTGNQNNDWELKNTLTGSPIPILPDIIGPKNNFGSSTVINDDGDIIVIGQPVEFGNNTPGSIFIYTGNPINGWAFKQKIDKPFESNTTEDFAKNDSIDINSKGDIIVVGSDIDKSIFIYTGNKNSNWNLYQLITSENTNGTNIKISKDGSLIFAKNNIYKKNQDNLWELLDTFQNSGFKTIVNQNNFILISSNTGLNNVDIYNLRCDSTVYYSDDTRIVLKNQLENIINYNNSWHENSGIFYDYNYIDLFDSKDSAGTILNIKNDSEYFVSSSPQGDETNFLNTGYSGYSTYLVEYSNKNPYDPFSNYNHVKQQITIKQFRYENTGFKISYAFDKSVATYNLSGDINSKNLFSWSFNLVDIINYSGIFFEDQSLVTQEQIYQNQNPPILSKKLTNYFESFQTVCKFRQACDVEIGDPEPGLQIVCWTGVDTQGEDFKNWLRDELQKNIDTSAAPAEDPRNLIEAVGVELYFTVLSGYLLYNTWITGEKIIWDLYNFNYDQVYRQWHLNNTPPYPPTGFVLTYPYDWNSIDSLVDTLNNRLNNPISYPVWYPYPCTSGEFSGLFVDGPLMRFWKNSGTTGDGLPSHHVGNRIDFVSLRNLPQISVKAELLNKNPNNEDISKNLSGIKSSELVLDTSYKFDLITFDNNQFQRGLQAYRGYRYLLPQNIILKGLNANTDIWETLDTFNLEEVYSKIPEKDKLKITFQTKNDYIFQSGVLFQTPDLEEILGNLPEPICQYRELFSFNKIEQTRVSKNIFCPPLSKETTVKFVFPENCPPYIISGSQIVEVDNVYWCQNQSPESEDINCPEPIPVPCPEGLRSILVKGADLLPGECPYYTCEVPLINAPKQIPTDIFILKTGSNFTSNAGFNSLEDDEEILSLSCGEEILFKNYKELKVELINFFQAPDVDIKERKRRKLLPLFPLNKFYVQNINFFDARNVPLNIHIAEPECIIGADYEIDVSGLVPLRFTGFYSVDVTGQNQSGEYKFNNAKVVRKIDDEERFIKFNKVSGYIYSESGTAFLNKTITASGTLCYNFDQENYFFYDPQTTIVSFEQFLCQDNILKTGKVLGEFIIVKPSVINREILVGGRYNTPIGFVQTTADSLVNGIISDTPYRAYNVTGIYNISGTATGIAENGVLEVDIKNSIRPFEGKTPFSN